MPISRIRANPPDRSKRRARLALDRLDRHGQELGNVLIKWSPPRDSTSLSVLVERLRCAPGSPLVVADQRAYFRCTDDSNYEQARLDDDHQASLGGALNGRCQATKLWERIFNVAVYRWTRPRIATGSKPPAPVHPANSDQTARAGRIAAKPADGASAMAA
jgi:hypothetical protein